jgi:hypothetical protein
VPLDDRRAARIEELASVTSHLHVFWSEFMKITVIKKSDGKVKTMYACPWMIDEPPVATKA